MPSTAQVLNTIPDLTYRQLDYWIRLGLVAPTARGTGSGIARDIPQAEVRVLRLMVDLVAEGLTPSRAAQVARHLIADGHAPFGGLWITRRAS